MTEREERQTPPREDKERVEEGRRGRTTGAGYQGQTPGADPKGAVEGIGGTGGSSGAGATRVKIRDAGEVSGIDYPATEGTSDTKDVTDVSSAGSGTASGYRRSTSGSDGLHGKTRGPDSETVPNPDDDNRS